MQQLNCLSGPLQVRGISVIHMTSCDSFLVTVSLSFTVTEVLKLRFVYKLQVYVTASDFKQCSV